MLIKAFELKNEFPFDMSEGVINIDRDRLIPTAMHRGTANLLKNYHTLKPGLGNDITLFGVTHAQNSLNMVVFSNGTATRYYWFGRNQQYTYLVRNGSRDLDEAWANLFKSFMLDGSPSGQKLYPILKAFVLDYLKSLGNTELRYTLSGRWKNEFVYMEVVREAFMTKTVTVTVNDRTRVCGFDKHPLVEMVDNAVTVSKVANG